MGQSPLSLSKKAFAFSDSFLQGAAAHSLCSHVCALRSVFCHAHVAPEN